MQFILQKKEKEKESPISVKLFHFLKKKHSENHATRNSRGEQEEHFFSDL